MKIMLRRAALGALLALAALTLIASPAQAAENAATAVHATAAVVAFTLDPVLVIQLVVSIILPLLVGLVTKTKTDGGVKAALLAGFALAASLLNELGAAIAAGVTYDLGQGLLLALPTFLIAVGLHYGLWKPIGAAAKLQEIGSSRPLLRRDLRGER